MGNHGCVIPGRGCQAWQALEGLYQQSPLAGIVLGGLILVILCVVVVWLLEIRGKTNWKPHEPYRPPQPDTREREREPSQRQ